MFENIRKKLLNFFRKISNLGKPRIEETKDNVIELASDEFYEDYEKCLKINEEDINRCKKYVEEYTQKFENIKKEYPEGSKEYEEAKYEMYRWIIALDRKREETKFIRPNTKEDIAYREKQYSKFPEKLQEVLLPNLDLRFHSTPIYFAKQIIQTQQITSIPDRYDGHVANSDSKGIISASNSENIKLTIQNYAELLDYKRSLPAGCVFAFFPKDKDDAEITKYRRNEIGSVNFRQNPEQLFGIFTTPENIERVKKWMRESKLDPNIVYTYEEFLEAVKEKEGIEDKNSAFRQKINEANWMNNINPEDYIVPDPDLYQDENVVEEGFSYDDD